MKTSTKILIAVAVALPLLALSIWVFLPNLSRMRSAPGGGSAAGTEFQSAYDSASPAFFDVQFDDSTQPAKSYDALTITALPSSAAVQALQSLGYIDSDEGATSRADLLLAEATPTQQAEFTRQLLEVYRPRRRSGRSGDLPVRYTDADNLRQAIAALCSFASLRDDEELWVIQRSEVTPFPRDDARPSCGMLTTRLPGEDQEVPLPLTHTDVDAWISGYIATVDVTQQYQNPYESKIEAVYVFPLPHNAAVNEFVMTIGERRIRGIIREREEAKQIYDQAKQRGHVASLLTQERANVFTQSVANIEPGKEIDINIKYFHTLAYADGWYEYVFPMVVGPRFNPAGSADGLGAVARGKSGASGQATEVQYLAPGERSGHDIAVSVHIDAGVEVEDVQCRSHVIDVDRTSDAVAEVTLAASDTIPNKDFVLRYKVAGETVKSAMITHHDQRGGFFSLMLYPPEELSSLQRAPVEMIFVLDCSGSMSGQPIAQAKSAIKRALHSMWPQDTFQVIRFSNNASQLGPAPLPATPDNIARGLAYVDSLSGGGGTMMIEGIKAALDFPHDAERLRYVAFMTDGFIGNEYEILAAVHDRLGDSRIFSFGVGSSPNHFLLDGLARLGRGAVAYLGLNDSASEVMDHFFGRIAHPALTDINIDWGGLEVADVYPAQVPDLFVGRPVILTGRFEGQAPDAIRVTGRTGASDETIEVPTGTDQPASEHDGLAAVWARKKIAELASRTMYDTEASLPRQIKQLALDYSLMSAYTSFVAVDSLTRTAGDFGTTVAVPVPVPDGVRYDTTVQE